MAASKTLTPQERTLRARIAALTLHAGGGTTTTAARAAFARRFEEQVDPGGLLTPEVRARRAEQARRAHFLRMSLASAKARRTKAAS